MKVCHIALAFVLAHGATSAAVKRKGFGPKDCVGVARSAAGSCVLSTDCEGFDLSTTEFAFDCVAQQGIVRHSFGVGGFEASEEFDTEVKCDRCETGSATDVIVKKPVEQAAPPAKAKHHVTVQVPRKEKLPAGSVVFNAKHRSGKGGQSPPNGTELQELNDDMCHSSPLARMVAASASSRRGQSHPLLLLPGEVKVLEVAAEGFQPLCDNLAGSLHALSKQRGQQARLDEVTVGGSRGSILRTLGARAQALDGAIGAVPSQ